MWLAKMVVILCEVLKFLSLDAAKLGVLVDVNEVPMAHMSSTLLNGELWNMIVPLLELHRQPKEQRL